MGKKRRNKPLPPPIEAFGDCVVAKNKRAAFNFELGDRFEAGLVLVGSEVKMLRHGSADLTDAWCAIERGEAFVHGINIPVPPGAAFGGHKPKRRRKLLLNRHEIDQLQRAIDRQGMTAVVTLIYFRKGRAKLEIALAKGKRTVDKRHAMKERDADREAEAAIRARK